nr:hypothetical protein [Tanacetum cinerariifolium]
MIELEAYKTYYAYATGEKTPKPKYVQMKADSKPSPKKKLVQDPKGKRLKATTKKSNNDEDDDDADNQGDDDQDDNNADNDDDDGQDDDNEQTESDNDGDDFVHPNLSTFDEEERHDKKLDEEEKEGDNVEEEKLDREETNKEEDVNELYRDMNINLEGRNTEMTYAILHNSSFKSLGFISNMLNPNPNTAEVLTRSSNEAKTSHVVAGVEMIRMKTKNPLLDKTRDPREEELEKNRSSSAPTEKTSKSSSKSKEGSKSHHKSTGKSGQAEEPIHTAEDLEKLTPQEFNTGLRVIPFDHFINNGLAYLRGGASSRTYATSVTKTKAAVYRHINGIEDLVPNTMWSPVLTALDDILKRIKMKYLLQTYWRNVDKERAGAMI